jgi:hypothetical protein
MCRVGAVAIVASGRAVSEQGERVQMLGLTPLSVPEASSQLYKAVKLSLIKTHSI